MATQATPRGSIRLAPSRRETERRAKHFDALVEALAWALPYAKEHAEQGSQCCGAAEHSEAEGICAQCHEHTGFDNPDLEHAQAALKAAGEVTDTTPLCCGCESHEAKG